MQEDSAEGELTINKMKDLLVIEGWLPVEESGKIQEKHSERNTWDMEFINHYNYKLCPPLHTIFILIRLITL